MIGRYTNTRNYKELLQMNLFYRVSAGSVLILSAYILSRYDYLLWAHISALVAVAILGGAIIAGAIRGMLNRELNVDELVSLAIVASVIIGEYLPAAMVALIMLLGSLCEEYTSQKARQAINTLISLNPDQATVIRNGIEVSVPAMEIMTGERIIIRSGDKVPIDGRIVRGYASFNESSLTGESLPMEKTIGDAVYSGTVNYSGMVEVEVEKVGEDTTLGKLIKLVQDTENSKDPIFRITDHYARYFTPLILFLAILTYFLSGDLYRAITILIVGCPCAFILAAPTAIISALGNASQNGILIKGGAYLEEVARLTMIIFDKTGTLTTGTPLVTDITPLNGATPEQVMARAASTERYSNHPLARAVIDWAHEKKLELQEPQMVNDFPAIGVEAIFAETRTFVGSVQEGDLKVIEASGLPGDFQGIKTLVVKENDNIYGLVHFQDVIRPEVHGLINSLKRAGIKEFLMLTGDNDEVASEVAKRSGIEKYQAGLLPVQKLAIIKEYQQRGYKVAMIGDGINDAPSLAAADIGIAMGAMGTEAALEAADIAFMSDDLSKLPYLLSLGITTVHTIHISIILALSFNLLSLLASGLGWLSPITGAIAHNLGSVVVLLNSARLIRYSPPDNHLI